MKTLLLDALRGLHNRRGSTLVATGGLMLAMTACLLVALLAIALSDPDPAISEPKRVVLLDFKSNVPGQPSAWYGGSPMSFATMLKARQEPLDQISRVGIGGLDISNQGRLQAALLLIADPDLVPLLGLKTLHGDLRAALAQRDGIAITAGLVRKLWGELPPEEALGRRLEASGDAHVPAVYTVTAVIPYPDPRSPLGYTNPMLGDAMAMVGFESQLFPDTASARDALNAIYRVNGRVFARLHPGASVDQVGGWMREAFMASPLHATLPPEWRAGREAAFFRGVTLTRLPFEGAANALRWQLLRAVAAASVLMLILAALNCMNLQTASLLQRQRETALRRSLGADGAQLLHLWSVEVLLPLLLSAAGALLLAWWSAPAVANWMGLSPAQPIADPLPSRVLVGTVLTVLALLPLSLALPATMALRAAPAPALQGRTASEGPGGRRVRQALLALQLGGALLLLPLASVLAMQQQYLLHADRGLDTRNRLWLGVMVNPAFVPNMDAFLAALNQHPAVRSWAFGDGRPDTRGLTEQQVSSSQHKAVLRLNTVSPAFFDTWGMKLLAGSPQMGAGEAHLVIDAKAARLLGFVTPQAAVGELLRGGGDSQHAGTELRRVVAVVRDVKLESARDPALPQAFLLSDRPQWDLTVRGTNLPALRQAVEELWISHGPKLVYDIQSADEQRASAYRQEGQMTTMLAAVALLTVGVAMLGAYALSADTLRRRRTELVLRRLHGAGNAAITRHVVADFAVSLVVAAAFGLPIAAWLGQIYLAGFVDRVGPITGLVLPTLVAATVTLVATAAATGLHVRQAIAIQPIEALR